MSRRDLPTFALLFLGLLAIPLRAQRAAPAGPPTADAYRSLAPPHLSQAIGDGLGFFGGNLGPGDAFGHSVAPLGDFNADGVPDLVALGAESVWLLLLNRSGLVIDEREIPASVLGFAAVSVDSIGDLDGDGITDLAVGRPETPNPGSVWILFLNADGSVKSQVRIEETPGAGASLGSFGRRLTGLGDLDGDGVPDLAVAAAYGVWVLLMDPDGTARSRTEFFPGFGGFPNAPSAFDPDSNAWVFSFADALDALGDFDGDGVVDLLVSGQEWLFEGQIGHVWLVYLLPDGTVKAIVDINSYGLGIHPIDNPCAVWYGDGAFGYGATVLGDVDGNGVTDLAVGSPDPFCCLETSSTWILKLRADGSVRRSFEVTGDSPPYDLPVQPLDLFGFALASPGDIDGDGRLDLAVGAPASMGTPDPWCEYNEDPVGLLWVLFGLP